MKPILKNDLYGQLTRDATAALKDWKVEEAEALAKKAIAEEHTRPEAFNILGIVMEIRNDQYQAQTYYRAALAFDPAYDPARKNLDRSTGVNNSVTWDMGDKR